LSSTESSLDSSSPPTTLYTNWDCSSSRISTCSAAIAAKAFVTLACLFSFFSAICLLVTLALSDRIKSTVLVAGKVLAFVSFIFGVIGVAFGYRELQILGTSWIRGQLFRILILVFLFSRELNTCLQDLNICLRDLYICLRDLDTCLD